MRVAAVVLAIALLLVGACAIFGGGYGDECVRDDDCRGDLVCAYHEGSCGSHGKCASHGPGGGVFCSPPNGCDCEGNDIKWDQCRPGAPVPIRWEGLCDAGARIVPDGAIIPIIRDAGTVDVEEDAIAPADADSDGD